MGDGALSPNAFGTTVLGSAGGTAPSRSAYGDWKASMFANLTSVARSNSRRCRLPRHAAAAGAGELRDAVYVGGKKVFSDDYLKQLTPLSLAVWYMDDGCFTVRSKGLQQRTAGGSGRIEICVEAMSATLANVCVRNYLADTWGIEAKLVARGAGRKGSAPVPDRRDGEVPGIDRTVRPPVDGVQAAAALPGAVRRRAGVRRARQVLTPMRDHQHRW